MANQRNREFEVMESGTRALREAKSSLDVSERLMFETLRLIRSQHAAVLLINAQGELQRESCRFCRMLRATWCVTTMNAGMVAAIPSTLLARRFRSRLEFSVCVTCLTPC